MLPQHRLQPGGHATALEFISDGDRHFRGLRIVRQTPKRGATDPRQVGAPAMQRRPGHVILLVGRAKGLNQPGIDRARPGPETEVGGLGRQAPDGFGDSIAVGGGDHPQAQRRAIAQFDVEDLAGIKAHPASVVPATTIASQLSLPRTRWYR